MLQEKEFHASIQEITKGEPAAVEGLKEPDMSVVLEALAGCCSAAKAQLYESFCRLLYVVLLSAQPRADLQNLEIL